MSYAESLKVKAAAELERRRRARLQAQLLQLPVSSFLKITKIKVPQEDSFSAQPFALWPAQQDVLDRMMQDRLLVILKARQLGITWLACGYVLWLCTQNPGKTVLVFSQGQNEANELIDRIRFLYQHHQNLSSLPTLTIDNTQELEWSNGSNVKSLPATKRAGRSFTASLVIFDEFAFMLYGPDLYAAAKPTIDDGGRLWIISSADGMGTRYHQFWQAAKSGNNGFKTIFLPWTARPSRGQGWREARLAEAFADASEVKREYPENDIEAFTHAAGVVYSVWSDGPEDGNVTEQADYVPDAGVVYWAADDGYAGKLDSATGHYTADSHPRVFLLIQEMPNGDAHVFAESYAVGKLSDEHIDAVMRLSYPFPDYAAIGPGFAEFAARLRNKDIPVRRVQTDVEERIKETRRWIAKDQNGHRRLLVHPRCVNLRREMMSYRRDNDGHIIKQFDHGPDALGYYTWTKRHE